jgi:hypothetical protein
VLFVPSFFIVVQGVSERRAARKAKRVTPPAPAE